MVKDATFMYWCYWKMTVTQVDNKTSLLSVSIKNIELRRLTYMNLGKPNLLKNQILQSSLKFNLRFAQKWVCDYHSWSGSFFLV
jgi:hypothetical protein